MTISTGEIETVLERLGRAGERIWGTAQRIGLGITDPKEINERVEAGDIEGAANMLTDMDRTLGALAIWAGGSEDPRVAAVSLQGIVVGFIVGYLVANEQALNGFQTAEVA